MMKADRDLAPRGREGLGRDRGRARGPRRGWPGWTLVAGSAAAAVLTASMLILLEEAPLARHAAGTAPAVAPAAAPARSDERAALYLVRSTLMALDDANRTGNYAVLQLLGSQSFKSANTAERLAEIFAVQRQSGLDLSAAALDIPIWSVPPTVGPDRLLRLVGSYELALERLRFAIAFVAEGGAWRLYEIHVGVEPGPERLAGAASLR